MTRHGAAQDRMGKLIRFSNTTILDGDLTVRAPWRPTTSSPARSATMRCAGHWDPREDSRSSRSRWYQRSRVLQINALLPLIRLEDPAPTRRELRMSPALRMIAEAFRPPVGTCAPWPEIRVQPRFDLVERSEAITSRIPGLPAMDSYLMTNGKSSSPAPW